MAERIDTFCDIESFPNFFSVIFKYKGERYDYIIYEDRNDLKSIVEFCKINNICLVTFNGIHYDNVIFNYLITYFDALSKLSGKELAANINKLSQAIINFDDLEKKQQRVIRELRYKKYYKFIDVLEVIREGYNVRSLKAVAVNLKWEKIQDLPYHYLHEVKEDEVQSIMDYNYNDVLITERVFEYIQPRIKMREVLSLKYGVNVLSDADSKIAKTTFNKFYVDYSGLRLEEFEHLRSKRTELPIGELIFDWVKFETKELQDYLELLKGLTITDILEQGKCDIPELEFDGNTYTLALGGIHSVDKPGIFEADDNNMLLDIDVQSHYPNCILNNKVSPEHLNQSTFSSVLQMIVDERISNKKLGKSDPSAKILSDGLKISINTSYGLFNYKGYYLYDPKCTYEVTINNQMSLLMLIEDLYLNGVSVITTNTDGTIVMTHPDNLELVRSVYKRWELETGFLLEETFYSKYIRRDINNFLSIKTDNTVKVKGIFIPQGGILKGYDKPIVAIALRNYFVNNIPIETTILNIGTPYIFSNLQIEGEERVTDIYDYCHSKKVGGTYERAEFHEGDNITVVQRTLRYYASNSGGQLYKVKIIPESVTEDGELIPEHESKQSLLVDSKVTLFNDYVDGPYDINYQYYIEEARKVICQIQGQIYIHPDKLNAKIEKLEEAVSKNQAKYDMFISKGSKSKAVEVTLTVLNKQKLQLEELLKLR